MTVNHVPPFRVFKTFVEFYPRLGATIAIGAMDAAVRMIPTSGAGIDDAPEVKAERPGLVAPAHISGPQKRSSSRQRKGAHKRRLKDSKRALGRRNAG
jgi:hypothetical protein